MLHKEINFLVFFGKHNRHEIKRMPTAYRKKEVEWTIENLKMIYGDGSDTKSSGTRDISPNDLRK